MSNPGPLFRPYEKFVTIILGDQEFRVPEGNMLLRAFQYLSPENVSYGRFCWNEDSQYCPVNFDLGPKPHHRRPLSCHVIPKQLIPLTQIPVQPPPSSPHSSFLL